MSHTPPSDPVRNGAPPGCAVFIYFGEPAINELFSELLESRGLETQIVHDPNTVQAGAKVITEPQLYEHLAPETQRRCLVIGNKDAMRHLDVITLARPLTEEKIEAALAKFLGAA